VAQKGGSNRALRGSRYAHRMDASEVVQRLDEWVREAMIDESTGVPPDAKFDIQPSSSSILGGVSTRGFNLDFRFAPSKPDEAIDGRGSTSAGAGAGSYAWRAFRVRTCGVGRRSPFG
jgi:hypothetical protein